MIKMHLRPYCIQPTKCCIYYQGRSQPHSPGWATVPLSSFFPQILINFSSNFTYFLRHFGPPGGRVAHPGRPWLRHCLLSRLSMYKHSANLFLHISSNKLQKKMNSVYIIHSSIHINPCYPKWGWLKSFLIFNNFFMATEYVICIYLITYRFTKLICIETWGCRMGRGSRQNRW